MWIPIEERSNEKIDKEKMIIRKANVNDADDICKICQDDLGYNCTVDLVKERIAGLDLWSVPVSQDEWSQHSVPEHYDWQGMGYYPVPACSGSSSAGCYRHQPAHQYEVEPALWIHSGAGIWCGNYRTDSEECH